MDKVIEELKKIGYLTSYDKGIFILKNERKKKKILIVLSNEYVYCDNTMTFDEIRLINKLLDEIGKKYE